MIWFDFLKNTLNYSFYSAKQYFLVISYRLQVDGGRGFVHDEDTGLAQEGTGQTEQLALANAEILSTLSHKEIF